MVITLNICGRYSYLTLACFSGTPHKGGDFVHQVTLLQTIGQCVLRRKVIDRDPHLLEFKRTAVHHPDMTWVQNACNSTLSKRQRSSVAGGSQNWPNSRKQRRMLSLGFSHPGFSDMKRDDGSRTLSPSSGKAYWDPFGFLRSD